MSRWWVTYEGPEDQGNVCTDEVESFGLIEISRSIPRFFSHPELSRAEMLILYHFRNLLSVPVKKMYEIYILSIFYQADEIRNRIQSLPEPLSGPMIISYHIISYHVMSYDRVFNQMTVCLVNGTLSQVLLDQPNIGRQW
jgi:hypothetical protein